MSKERLEEIVEKIAEQLYDRIFVPKTKVTMEYQDIKYLFNTIEEQSERVQELEEKSEELSWKFAQLASKEVEIRKQNKRYRATINAMQQILKDAIHSLDVGEKVQGLEYGVQMANEALEESK